MPRVSELRYDISGLVATAIVDDEDGPGRSHLSRHRRKTGAQTRWAIVGDDHAHDAVGATIRPELTKWL